MKEINSNLGIGDFVIVKKNVTCPDSPKVRIEGWKGRVFDIDSDNEGNVIIGVEWSEKTINSMPRAYIDESEGEGMDYESLYLSETELEKSDGCLKHDDDKAIHLRRYYGEATKRIMKILRDPDEGYLTLLERWETFLSKTLVFPFDAEVIENVDSNDPNIGDKVSVKSVSGFEDLRGILVEFRKSRRKYIYPLCELEAEKDCPNYRLVNDYCIWFDNK